MEQFVFFAENWAEKFKQIRMPKKKHIKPYDHNWN